MTDEPASGDAFATRAVHAGAEPDEATGAVAPPIYQTSTFAQEGVGRPRNGYEYARSQNPTRERLERAVADLEGGRHGIAFASGSAATAAIAQLAAAGEEILVGDDVYGGTFRYFERVHRSEEHTSELQSPPTRRSSDLRGAATSTPDRRTRPASGSSVPSPTSRAAGTGSRSRAGPRRRRRSRSSRPRARRSSSATTSTAARSATSSASTDRKSTRLNSSHPLPDALPISAERLRVRPIAEPDPRAARACRRRPRGRPARDRVRERVRGDGGDRAARGRGRGDPRRRRRLRRHVPLLRARPQIGRAHV